MKLRRLECFCEVAANGFSLSRAAQTLRATQPAVTRQIQLLEEELGFTVFQRRGHRVLKMTTAGEVIFKKAQRILAETKELQQVRPELEHVSSVLKIATTDFNARYTLLPAIRKFRSEKPNLSFSILSVDPAAAAEFVSAGKADLGLSASTPQMSEELVSYKCFDVDRVVITPRLHPLTREKRLTLAKIAAYPLIIYDTRLSGGRRVLDAFEERGINVQVALSASTADTIKAYVAEGIGVGVIQSRAFDKERDTNICALKATSLFGVVPDFVFFRKNSLALSIVRDFIPLLIEKRTRAESVESGDEG